MRTGWMSILELARKHFGMEESKTCSMMRIEKAGFWTYLSRVYATPSPPKSSTQAWATTCPSEIAPTQHFQSLGRMTSTTLLLPCILPY